MIKHNLMHDGDSSGFISRPLIKLSLLRQQDELVVFIEKPSDRYTRQSEDTGEDKNARINGSELFSLFTADIIKKEVIFIR